jgi:hypothetical protein
VHDLPKLFEFKLPASTLRTEESLPEINRAALSSINMHTQTAHTAPYKVARAVRQIIYQTLFHRRATFYTRIDNATVPVAPEELRANIYRLLARAEVHDLDAKLVDDVTDALRALVQVDPRP